jgi:NAD(P)-dependent dehydrogenase (short-subunit alcohol dehydrogenase family)
MDTQKSLRGRVAPVTGATGGIGRTRSLAFAPGGACVDVCYLTDKTYALDGGLVPA